MAGGSGEGASLEYTPTWIVALVCIIIVAISLLAERILHFSGKIQQWRHWEESIQKREYDPEEAMRNKITHVGDNAFIRKRLSGASKIGFFRWLKSFFKQFYGSVSKLDYTTLRLGFVMNHCKANPKFDFYKYMIRAFENDFKKVVGISWYLWVFVVLFLLVNVYGWHAYFWISFVPLTLLLAVGTKLEHIITQLGKEVAQRHTAVTGDLVVKPSDDHFWFNRPRLVLVLIHVILFQNAFEIAIFFWMLVMFGFDSCIMGEIGFIVPRLVIGVFVQFLCSYSTLPLYAIVAQMGSSFNSAIFEDHIQESLAGWVQKAKRNKGPKRAVGAVYNHHDSPSPQRVEMKEIQVKVDPKEQKGKVPEIEPSV
ncbi:MLO-like protein [Striga asiatica]|uniref:MLO-like protein n=1 Tax=Striga asiatica TaxID=4170 RepID=A0A5A7PN63_STRAF|nr:MLO-like protein [Striga asiatica]